ncbi:hypothetical protein LWI28_029055 [Acer negundo]|uniref:Uncharacterized protein n=1 Tax=Acer negundo TaxID=4023 RepID=A0AAD5NL04_ACENE|nr:hypothetical protein LWI28_029055 [Acer negundo]
MVSPSMPGFVENPMVLEATLCSSSPTSVPICGPSFTVVGSIPIPLLDVHIVQQVYSLLPREASSPPFVFVSSGGHIMESFSSLVPHEVSPYPHVVSSGGLIIESLPSDSHVELGFVVVTPWPNQVDVEVSDPDRVDQRFTIIKSRLESFQFEFQTELGLKWSHFSHFSPSHVHDYPCCCFFGWSYYGIFAFR